jgi:hypothetical protein
LVLADQPAVLHVAHEARLIDRHHRAEAHRHRGELPEAGHQPRVRVRRQAAAFARLTAEAVELVLGQPAFQERARVDAGRAVTLKVDQVGAVGVVVALEEVVVADIVERRRGRERGDVAADARLALVGLDHDRHRVPAHVRADAVLELFVARIARFVVDVDRVEVRGRRFVRQVSAGPARLIDQRFDQVMRTFLADLCDDGFERIEPLLRLLRIGIRCSTRGAGAFDDVTTMVIPVGHTLILPQRTGMLHCSDDVMRCSWRRPRRARNRVASLIGTKASIRPVR